MSQEERPSVFKDSEVDNAMEKIDLSRIASGVKRRLWLPVVFGIVLAFGFGILSQHLLKKYNAQVLLLYKAQNRQLNVPGMKGGFNVGFFSMPTMVDMLSLPTHYDAVKSILGLQQTPEQIGEMVSVSIPNKQADLIQISCTADSPGLAVDIVNTLATVGVKHSQTVRGNQLQIARDYFADQARLAQDKLSRKMVEIAQFKKEHNFVSLHTDGTGSLAGMEEAEKQLRDGKMEYESLLIEYENLRREVGKIPDHIVREAYQDDPIRSRIGQTELALLRARTRYAEDNPKVKVLEEELTQLRRMVSESSFEDANDRVYVKNEMKDHLNIELVRLQGRLRAAQKRKEEAELVLNQMNQDFANLPEEQIEFSRLVHSKSMLEEELSMSEEAIRSVDILISLGRGDVELYQTAERAERNKSMFLTFLPVVGLGLGLTLGLVAALMLELADGRLCTGKELTQRYSPPCIQVIPELSRLNPATAEQKTLFFIRNISDRLTYLRGKESLRSILVTSGINGEGKSTIAWNLARYQARLGKKVCYLQFDHQPSTYWAEKKNKKALNDYLRGKGSIEESLETGTVDRAYAIWGEDLKEIIRSHAGEQLFQVLGQRYDLVIVDGPGIVDDDYAINLCRRVDTILYVVGSTKTKTRLVDSAMQELEQNGIVPTGIVLNRVKASYCGNDPRLAVERKRSRRWGRTEKKA